MTDNVALLLRVGFSFSVVLVLMWVAARVLRSRTGGRPADAVEVLARTQLGRGSNVTVLRIGDRALVLGVTERSITQLGDPISDLAALRGRTVTSVVADDEIRSDVPLPTPRSHARRSAAPSAPQAMAGQGALADGHGCPAGTDRPEGMTRLARTVAAVLLFLAGTLGLSLATASTASAVNLPIPGPGVVTLKSSTAKTPKAPTAPKTPKTPAASGTDGSVSVNLGGLTNKPSSSVTVILAITLLSVAPALLLMMTSFTKIVVVLSLTRNALGLQGIPPNQVLAGLALFLSLFVMGPVLSQVNSDGIQPYLDGTKSQSQAFDDGIKPLREFMLDHTRSDELAMLSNVADRKLPETREEVPITTLIPAFVLSELKSAFIIGFVIFVPFLIIDIVVSAALMSMGMMMLPPVMISLPFKILLFVLVDGWALIITALVQSYG